MNKSFTNFLKRVLGQTILTNNSKQYKKTHFGGMPRSVSAHILSFLLILFSSCSISQESIPVSIKLAWNDKGITGFPRELIITKTDNDTFEMIALINDSGRTNLILPPGEYKAKPTLNYHWMGERFIRIDETSALLFKVEQNANLNFDVNLSTLPWPATPNEVGLLLKEQALQPTEIDAFFKERLGFFEVPGASVAIFKNNKIIYEGYYGVTHIEKDLPVTKHTLFEAGSITKFIFSFAVMRLYEKGQIDLDRPLVEYMAHPEIEDTRYLKMTARHVLSHRSGMANWPRKNENGKIALKYFPGKEYTYSGKAFEYLKLVVEKITSQTIDEVIHNEAIEPLSLKDMYFKNDIAIKSRGAHGHKKNIASEIFMPKRTMVAYTLQTTSRSLAEFAIAINQRRGLSPEVYDEFLSVQSTREDQVHWGLGLRIEETEQGISFGHSGSTGRGFISNLVIYDKHGVGFAIVTNSHMGGWLSIPLLNEYLVLGNANAFKNE
jgi:CubicO group peptidase (beta-lactamase class C family)